MSIIFRTPMLQQIYYHWYISHPLSDQKQRTSEDSTVQHMCTTDELLDCEMLDVAPLWHFSVILVPDTNVTTYLLTYSTQPVASLHLRLLSHRLQNLGSATVAVASVSCARCR